MKEHVLSASDRAVLQGLIPLAGTLGAGTLFALFFGGRRKTGLAVFEVFAIVAVLTAAALTAYACIELLHHNKAVSNHALTETAVPLIVAVFLLVFVVVFSRLPGSILEALTILPLGVVVAWVAAELVVSNWAHRPAEASLVALLILGVGALLAVIGWGADRLRTSRNRNEQHRNFAGLIGAGYAPRKAMLGLALPYRSDDSPVAVLHCWRKKDRLYIDLAECKRLQREVDDRWDFLASHGGRPPAGEEILCRVKVSRWIPWIRARRSAQASVLEVGKGGEKRIHDLSESEDGLFDVTDHVVLDTDSGQAIERPCFD